MPKVKRVKKYRHLLLDGDVLVYSTAFSAQKTRYHYKNKTFDSAAECKAYCEEEELDYKALRKSEEITSSLEVMPERACINILAKKITDICNACASSKYTILLSGDGNYRDEIAKTKKYKGNRENVAKPQHYLYVRDLVLENRNTVMTVGVEADDAIGIMITEDPEAVVCTIDKDLNMLPGRHYNWGTGAMYNVGRTDSLYFFMKQLLTGDSTDNIPGIPGMGDKKAEALLLPMRDSPRAMFASVLEQYANAPFTIGDVTTGPADEYLDEQMGLLWIQRKPEERMTSDYYAAEYLGTED
jgi:hypothetical protein